MATFNVTTNANFQDAAFSTRAGNDTYNISAGARLTIDTDTRYCTNATATTGNLGPVTINSSTGGELYIDGTGVRLIPYNTGTGNVPAIGTTISQGGVSAYLLGVWSAFNAAPTAAGAAMPASGYIKVKNKTGGNFAAGALTGIGASATGADIVGWIEVVGVEAATCTVPRLGKVTARGEWFEHPTLTSGSAATTYQLPASLANTYYPGVWVETGAGTGVFEFYPNAGSLVAASSTGTDAVRGKVCWISSQGLLRLGSDGTNTVGFLPGSGRKIRVPNIVTINVTSAAMSTNALPNATLATRYDFTTTGAGVIDLDRINLAWYPSFAQPYSVTLANVAILEQLSVSEIASPISWSNVGVGQTAAQAQFALLMSLCFAGGAVTDCTWSCATLAASGRYVRSLTDVSGIAFTRDRVLSFVARGNATTGNATMTRVNSCTWTDCVFGVGRQLMTTCTDLTFTNSTYYDAPGAATGTGNPMFVWDLASACARITMSGLTFGGLTNVHPYSGILNVGAAGCTIIKLRNIGTRASPLSLGSANQSGLLLQLATGAAANDVRVQRCYVSNTRTNLLTGDNSSKNLLVESCAVDAADAPLIAVLNARLRAVLCTPPMTAQTSVYGSHWFDCFTSTTAGRIGLVMNEATADTTAQVTFTAGTPRFTSAGGLYMPTVGDQVVFEMPARAIAHTAFQNSAAVMAGGTIGNYTLEFDADTGSGFAGSWTTLNGANLSALSLNAATGVRLRLRITTAIANATAITSLYVLTTTNDAGRDNQYPLDLTTLTLTGLVSGSDVVILTAGTSTERANINANSGSTYAFQYEYAPGETVDVCVYKAGYVPFAIRGYALGSTDASLPIAQLADRNYANP